MNFSVKAGDGLVMDEEIIVWATAQSGDFVLQRYNPALLNARFQDQLEHQCPPQITRCPYGGLKRHSIIP